MYTSHYIFFTKYAIKLHIYNMESKIIKFNINVKLINIYFIKN